MVGIKLGIPGSAVRHFTVLTALRNITSQIPQGYNIFRYDLSMDKLNSPPSTNDQPITSTWTYMYFKSLVYLLNAKVCDCMAVLSPTYIV